VGKAILAFLEKADVDAIIRQRGLRRFTAHTITTRTDILTEVQGIRERGFSIDDCEHEDGVRCVGAPIRDHNGRVVASLSISAPTQRMPDGRIPELGKRVIVVANEISRLLGCPEGGQASVKKGS
jgi:IclR family acetate operon transcriptional repressor